MKKPIDPNLERFEDSVFSLTGGDDTPGVSYRAPQFEMKETSAAATPGEYHASENHRQRAEATGAPGEPAPGGEEHHHHHHHHHHSDSHSHSRHGKHRRHHHHHHHHADEVFTSWGKETAHPYGKQELAAALEALDTGDYGQVLRAKGIVAGTDGKWLHFDYVPGEVEIRNGAAGVTGRLCVIGAELKEDALTSLFHLN